MLLSSKMIARPIYIAIIIQTLLFLHRKESIGNSDLGLYVVILADSTLLSLPLEMLPLLQQENISSVSRDFSLQMLHHRLMKSISEDGGTFIVLRKKKRKKEKKNGLVRESNPGPLAPEARIIPLDQQASRLEFSPN